MTLSTICKTRLYSGLVLLFVLLVPVCNLGAIRFGFLAAFHNEAELVLFLLYAAPLWAGFIGVIGFELYRQVVMGNAPGRNLVQLLLLGGLVLPALGILLCPVGPALWSVSTGALILTHTLICTVLGLIIRYLLKMRQHTVTAKE
jgi:hypothetical protein